MATLSFCICLLGAQLDNGNTNTSAVQAAPVEEFKRRLALLSNLHITYRKVDRFMPAKELQKLTQNNPYLSITKGRFECDCHFRYLANHGASWERVPIGSAEPAEQLAIYTDSRFEKLTNRSTDQPLGVIKRKDKVSLPCNSIIDVAIALRGFEAPRWMDLADVQSIKRSKENEFWYDLTHARNDGYIDVWTLDSRYGYSPVTYRLVANGREPIRIECSDFVKYRDGMFIPASIKFVRRGGAEAAIRVTSELTVNHVAFGPNSPSDFRMAWPANTSLIDVTSPPVSRP